MANIPPTTARLTTLEQTSTVHWDCIAKLQGIAQVNQKSIAAQGESLEEIATALMGPRCTELQGRGRESGVGVIDKLERIEVRMANGGFKLALPRWFVVAMIGFMGTILAAVLEHII